MNPAETATPTMAPEALRAAAVAASRQLPVAGPITAEAPVPAAALSDVDGQAVTVELSGSAKGAVTLLVTDALAAALQDGPLAAPDLTAALTAPITDAVTELEVQLGGSLLPGVVRAAEAQALHFGASAEAVPLTDGAAVIAVLVVEVTAAAPVAAPELSDPGPFTPLVDDGPRPPADRSLELLHDVEMAVTVELGRTRMAVAELLALAPGAVVELDRAAGSPVDVLVNGKLIARGEVVVVDEDFAIRISEIVTPQRGRG